LYNIAITYIIERYTGLNRVGAMVGNMEEVKENKKVLYHFAVFAIVNKLLIIIKIVIEVWAIG